MVSMHFDFPSEINPPPIKWIIIESMDNYNYSPLIFTEIAEFLPNVIFTIL